MILFPLKLLTDHKICQWHISSQMSFLVCCEGAALSLSLAGRPQHRSPPCGAPIAGEDCQPRKGCPWQMWLARTWLFLNCPDAVSALFKKRKRERNKPNLEKPEENFLPVVVFCKHCSFLLPSPSTPNEAGDENGSFVPFPGAQLQRKRGSRDSPVHESQGGRARAVTVCGRSSMNTAW